MKHIFLALCLLSLALTSNAQELSFNRKGEFKIVQFTDTHFCLGNPKSDIALERVKEVFKTEKTRPCSLYRGCDLLRSGC